MSSEELQLLWHEGHQRGAHLMVVLHGFAEHPTAALQLGAMLDPERNYQICAPHGPIEVAANKYAFYKSESRMTPNPDDFASAQLSIASAIENAQTEANVDEVVIVGFSQGAGLASLATFSKTKKYHVHSLIVFGCRTYPEGLANYDLDAARDLHVYAGHGSNDRLSPSIEVKEFFDRLANRGVDVTWETHPYGHCLYPRHIEAASLWLQKLTQS